MLRCIRSFPISSKVEQVMLKGAVIQLTPQTEAIASGGCAGRQKGNVAASGVPSDTGWSFDIGNLKGCADSVLVFQHEDDEQTVRDIHLQMEQDANHQPPWISPVARNRDQRDLNLSMNRKRECSTIRTS